MWRDRKPITYLSPVRSLPAKLTTAVLNTKLENIVNRPAIPKEKQTWELQRNGIVSITNGLIRSVIQLHYLLRHGWLQSPIGSNMDLCGCGGYLVPSDPGVLIRNCLIIHHLIDFMYLPSCIEISGIRHQLWEFPRHDLESRNKQCDQRLGSICAFPVWLKTYQCRYLLHLRWYNT